jgi:hypothetical protein
MAHFEVVRIGLLDVGLILFKLLFLLLSKLDLGLQFFLDNGELLAKCLELLNLLSKV